MKKRYIETLVGLAALATLVPTLAGCGSDTSPPVPEEVLQSHGAQKSAAMQEAMKKGNPNHGPIPGTPDK